MRKSVLLYFLLICSLAVNSQNITIIDFSSKQTIEDVYIYSQDKSTISNAKGEANLSLFSKDAIIFFQHPSFENLHLNYKQIADNRFIVELINILYKLTGITCVGSKDNFGK